MRIGVVGYSGRFGAAAVDHLRGKGHTVIPFHGREFQPEDSRSLDYVLLATPVEAALKFIDGSHEPWKMVEICSVKKPFLRYAGKIISIHPLFGPQTINDSRFRNIIHISDISIPGSNKMIESIFTDSKIVSMSARTHDLLMLDIMVKPYILSLVASDLGLPEVDIQTGSYRRLMGLAEISENESRKVMMDTIAMNPGSAEIIERAIDYLKQMKIKIHERSEVI